MKNQNGITLIALVITIIVLLILAGVSISAVIGENGIATKAKESAKRTEEAKKEEEEYLEEVEEYLNDASPELNEYGFYFGQLYVGSMEGIGMGIILNEDGSADFFTDNQAPGYFIFSNSFPSGTFNYEEPSEEIVFSSDGEILNFDTLEMKCAYESTHGIYFGKVYEYTEKVTDDSTGDVTETIMTITFNEDGTGTMTGKMIVNDEVQDDWEQELPTIVTYESNGYKIVAEEELVASVSSDGNAILMNGNVFVRK